MGTTKMTLQRYRINNCADIADDNGGYCLSEDVADLEKIKWISVDDRLPEDDGEVLACVGSDVSVYQYDPWGDDCRKQWFEWQDVPNYGSEKCEVMGVTHWQPLPLPPTMTDKGEE